MSTQIDKEVMGTVSTVADSLAVLSKNVTMGALAAPLVWLNGKQFKHSGNSRKNRPGRKPEHVAAIIFQGGLTNANTVEPN